MSIATTASATTAPAEFLRVKDETLRPGHNVAKHAGARQVGVKLVRRADSIELTIADDGKGFDLVGTRVKGAGLSRSLESQACVRCHQRSDAESSGGSCAESAGRRPAVEA